MVVDDGQVEARISVVAEGREGREQAREAGRAGGLQRRSSSRKTRELIHCCTLHASLAPGSCIWCFITT